MKNIVGQHDIVFITLDTLRYDVAKNMYEKGATPNFEALIPEGWEKRHSPGTFTYAAHHAFFAGFLPTPAKPGKHARLFAASFAGSETTMENTFTFEENTIVEALRVRNYYSICIGGVGFFNQKTEIGRVFPNMFDEAHWSSDLSVTAVDSTANQFKLASARLNALKRDQRVFLFINVSALHQPNYFYLSDIDEDKKDTIASHAAALRYIDDCLPLLTQALEKRGTSFCIVCGDHGTAYGEDGFYGHRLGHDVVTTVPYAEFFLPSLT